MSKKTEQEAFEAWKKEAAAKMPDEDHRAAFEKVADLDMFKAHLRTEDYHRRLNQLEDERKKVKEDHEMWLNWYEGANAEAIKTKRELEKYKKMAKAGFTEDGGDDLSFLRDTTDTPDGDDKLRKDALNRLEERVSFLDKAAPAFTATMMKLMHKAIKEELDFDPEKVIRTAQEKGVAYDQAFEMLAEPTRAERREKEIQERLEKAREEGRREAMSKTPPPDSFPANAPKHSPSSAIAKLLGDKAPLGNAGGDPARVKAATEMFRALKEKEPEGSVL